MSASGPGDKQKLQARFWRKFQLLTRGRLDVRRAMDVIVEEERDPELKRTLQQLRTSLNEGQPLSEALAAFPGEFSRAVRELIRSAEHTGAWDEILPLISQGLDDSTLE